MGLALFVERVPASEIQGLGNKAFLPVITNNKLLFTHFSYRHYLSSIALRTVPVTYRPDACKSLLRTASPKSAPVIYSIAPDRLGLSRVGDEFFERGDRLQRAIEASA